MDWGGLVPSMGPLPLSTEFRGPDREGLELEEGLAGALEGGGCRDTGDPEAGTAEGVSTGAGAPVGAEGS